MGARLMDIEMPQPSATSGLKAVYERMRQLIVWLGLTELAWIGYWLLANGGAPSGYRVTVIGWIAVMLGWLVLAIYLGSRDFFLRHTRWLSNLVGVVLVVALAAVWFSATPAAREGVVRAAAGTSDVRLMLIHVLRLLAIGTVIKYIQGQLPLHFVIFGALPDFLFAISAVVVCILATNSPLGYEFLIAWHAIGFSLFLGAGISMFLSMPSPLRIYHDKPDASIVFQFPMVLAPNYTVPLFMIAHLFALVKLLT